MKNQNYSEIWAAKNPLPWCTLVTTGRAGTDFFQSLLDFHPEIFVFNGGLFFHTFWESARSVRYSQQPDLSDFMDEFVGAHLANLKSHYEPSENKNELGEERNQSINIDTIQFKSHVTNFLKEQPINSKNVLTAIYIAYSLSVGQNISRKKIIFSSCPSCTES